MNNTEFNDKINKLNEHHRKNCKAYDDICNGLGTVPFLPVAVFKDLDLYSVSEDKLRSRLTSSGTTGQKVSKIYLDGETAAAQQRALCDIVSEYIGEKRIPMLIIDSPDVLRDRKKYSARGAGIMGFSMMASKRYYALDKEMNLDWESINEFQAMAAEGPSFAFGFTFMVWAYFHNALKREKIKLNMKNCFLIHGGGWKKLQSQSVSNDEFKAGLRETCGIEHVSNYYGMAEQTGSIFMECPAGHLHSSDYSDITVLNPDDFSPCQTGEWGLIALESTLPESYPGHRLLTEDWGRIIGEDNCPCGRKDKYFEIQGRIKKAEIRGCSDTFAREASDVHGEHDAASAEYNQDKINVLAGRYPPEKNTAKPFDDEIMKFMEDLSDVLIREYRNYPEIMALGFWCRRSHIEKLRERHNGDACKGIGMVLHIAPSNMPTMFAYSWITSLLAGCSNVVRISGRNPETSMVILEAIRKVMGRHEAINDTNAFVQFDRNDSIIESLSEEALGRIIWGGDETVAKISAIPAGQNTHNKKCEDICFPDKYSIAVLDGETITGLSDNELRHQSGLFYNDTYGADQNACSSPKIVFWINGSEEAKSRWWNALAKETTKYDFQPWMATEKYRMICCTYALNHNLAPVKAWGNRLYVIPCNSIDKPLWRFEAAMGMFYECNIDSVEEIDSYIDSKIQTVVTNIKEIDSTYNKDKVSGEKKRYLDVDRVVSIGEALDFDTVWDRKDIIELLTE